MCTSSSAAKHSALKRKILGSSDFPLLTRRLLIGLTTGFFPFVAQSNLVTKQPHPIAGKPITVKELMLLP